MTNQPLRIVYVVSKWNQPTETFVRREVAAAREAGAEIQVISLRRPGSPDSILGDGAVRVVVPSLTSFVRGLLAALGRRPRAVAGGLWKLLSLGRPRTWKPHLLAWAGAHAAWRTLDEFDVVVAHFAWVSATTADQLARLHHKPYAVFPHAHDIYEQRCTDRYLGDRLRRAIAVFVESESIAADVEEMFGVEPLVMRMGVPDAFVTDRQRRAPGRPPLIVSVGALRQKKGHDRLIGAVAAMNDVTLTIAGEGPERPALEALIDHLDLGQRARLIGHSSLEKITTLLDEADVFCLASTLTPEGDRDGVPNVLIEAMARGVPVVSTPVSGIPDLLGGGCGYLTRDSGVDAVREAITAALEDERRRVAVIDRARQRVRESYTTSANWHRLERTLRERLGSHSRSP